MIHLEPQFPILVGDIGGTNARFQILETADSEVSNLEIVQTNQYSGASEAIADAVLTKTDLRPRTAILAAAGPITKDGLDLTNCSWNIQPQPFLDNGPFEQLVLLNDFEAQALSLPFLGDDDLLTIGPETLQNDPNQTKVVLGPGTGLGVGGLVRAADIWVPLAGEGGHVDLGPRTPREVTIWDNIEKLEGRVSGEQVLCGPGMLNVYRAICKTDGVAPTLQSPSEVSAAAENETNPQAIEALSLFCICLGRLAGDLAVTTMARGGVYIAGGIGNKIRHLLTKSGFRAAFEDKAPHSHLMRQISTYLVTHELPALVGLTAYARNPSRFGVDVSHRLWTLAGT